MIAVDEEVPGRLPSRIDLGKNATGINFVTLSHTYSKY